MNSGGGWSSHWIFDLEVAEKNSQTRNGKPQRAKNQDHNQKSRQLINQKLTHAPVFESDYRLRKMNNHKGARVFKKRTKVIMVNPFLETQLKSKFQRIRKMKPDMLAGVFIVKQS